MQFLKFDDDGFPTQATFDLGWVQQYLGTVVISGNKRKLLRNFCSTLDTMVIEWLDEPRDTLHVGIAGAVNDRMSFPLYSTYSLEDILSDHSQRARRLYGFQKS